MTGLGEITSSTSGNGNNTSGVLRLVNIPYHDFIHLAIVGNKLRCKLHATTSLMLFANNNNNNNNDSGNNSNYSNSNSSGNNTLIMEFSSISYMNIVREKILPMIFQHITNNNNNNNNNNSTASDSLFI